MSGTESSHVTLGEAWEAAAEAWSDYVRAGRDPFFQVNLRAFLELLPPPRGVTLDIGCGEGRLRAELEARGHQVLGVELSPTLAARARGRHEVVEADAAARSSRACGLRARDDAPAPLLVREGILRRRPPRRVDPGGAGREPAAPADLAPRAGGEAVKELWEREAHDWAAWAREPGHDSYWSFSPLFLELVPPPGRRTLDLGCGEGRVARDLAARGHSVVGIDASPTLVGLAREADPDGEYLVGDAAALPLEDASFDLVIAYNVLMDVDDMAGAVREAARVP